MLILTLMCDNELCEKWEQELVKKHTEPQEIHVADAENCVCVCYKVPPRSFKIC